MFDFLKGAIEFSRSVKSLRRTLDEKKKERHEIANAPLCKSDVLRVTFEHLDRCKERYDAALKTALCHVAGSPCDADKTAESQGINLLLASNHMLSGASLPVLQSNLLAILGDSLKEQLPAMIDRLNLPKGGLPLKDREKALAVLDTEIAKLQADVNEAQAKINQAATELAQ